MANIIVVFGSDAKTEVDPIIRKLREKEFDCLTYQEKLKTSPLGSMVITEMEKMVENAKAVIVFASPGLLNDGKAMFLLNCAAIQFNLLTVVLPGFSSSGMPISFYHAAAALTFQPGAEALEQYLLQLI